MKHFRGEAFIKPDGIDIAAGEGGGTCSHFAGSARKDGGGHEDIEKSGVGVFGCGQGDAVEFSGCGGIVENKRRYGQRALPETCQQMACMPAGAVKSGTVSGCGEEFPAGGGVIGQEAGGELPLNVFIRHQEIAGEINAFFLGPAIEERGIGRLLQGICPHVEKAKPGSG